MKCFIGIDLGSTTTKSVVIDENRNVLGRGITNSRSNYDTAAAVAKQEAMVSGRFHLFRGALEKSGALNGKLDAFLGQYERDFRLEQFLEQLADLEDNCQKSIAGGHFGDAAKGVSGALEEVFRRLREEAPALYAPGAKRKSDFFRDVAGSRYLAIAEQVAKDAGLRYDMLINVFDRSILAVENNVYADSMAKNLLAALERSFLSMPELRGLSEAIQKPVRSVMDMPMEETYVIGTGYGRARLPFSKEHVRSEILCHGLGFVYG